VNATRFTSPGLCARRTLGWCAALGLGLALAAAAAEGPPPGPSEYEVKAAFLYKFALFVDWPAAALGPTNTPFTIAIVGDDPFGPRLEAVLGKRTVHQRTLRFRRCARVEEALAESCQLLFVAPSEERRLPEILAALGAAPLLTVGDSAGYLAGGVMINLFVRERSVRFEINGPAVTRAGLRVSAQLQDLAVGPARHAAAGGH
jgi:hypothetical protein